MVVNMFMTEGRAGHVAFIFVWLVLSVYFLRGRWVALAGMLGSLAVILTLAFFIVLFLSLGSCKPSQT